MLDFMEKCPLELMEIPSAQHQIMGNHQMGEILDAYPKEQLKQKQKQQQSPPPQQEERKMRPPPDLPRRCPRCDSANTKFCYYNNYSLTQPRYFCKACRRYWTQGGTLRNVPVGGGCRKNKRLSSSSKRKVTPPPRDQASITTTNNSNQLYHNFQPQISYDPSDLTLAFAGLQSHDPFFLPNPNPNPNNVASYFPNGTGFLDILRTGFSDSTTTTATAGGRGGFQNLYYGYGGNYYGYTGNSNVGEVESSTVSEEVVVPFEASLGVGETSSAAGEVSSCKVVDAGENKMLMGLPWQVSTGDGDYWNAAAPWHGLINSSLI